MRVVLVGSGGREHALAWRIAQSPSLTSLVVVHDNPGWPAAAERRPANTVEAIVEVSRGADLVVVGPEVWLEAGLADALATAGIPCFGPTQAAARLETSKSFAKQVMEEAGVPTAKALVVALDDPMADARCGRGDVVLKVDGLAAGKGVFVCGPGDEALAALAEIRNGGFGASAARLVLEDRLSGPEVSLFALCDGERAVPLLSAQDHKRLMDGDQGPNTGGMGAYAPCPLVGWEDGRSLVEAVHVPVLRAMARRGTPFRGLLYAGLMMTRQGPKVLEFNARFGDPETQALMMLWDEDVLPWLHGAATGKLPAGDLRFVEGAACCVVVAAEGYPASPTKGTMIPNGASPASGVTFFAGVKQQGDARVVDGGRVLGITAVGTSLAEARDRAYAAVPSWRFAGAQFRTDIGLGGV